MKFSEAWLREWVNPELSTEQLGELLSMAGLELDAITPAAPAFDKVLVALVNEVSPHPDADRLKVCEIDPGDGTVLQVVCGAANVQAGMRVALAMVGAVLPGGLEIKRAKLRGVESFGMLCSAKELGLAESAAGLMRLPEDAPAGQSLREYLRLDDAVLEIDLTPNRADCLSVAGIAREVSALTGAPLDAPTIEPIEAAVASDVAVDIQSPEACPRYVGRAMRGINACASTPLWMQEKLRRAGIRSIAPVVDVTNYVMVELGQPMHAFDMAKLSGDIHVRFARDGEQLTLLDGRTVALDANTLVIADARQPLAMAGIMGGQASGVSEATRDIFLESAFFSPVAMAGRARHYGIHTDSSHRFERGVDPVLQARAIERATALLLDIVGGQPGPVIDVVHADSLPRSLAIELRSSRINRLLGISPAAPEVTGMLQALGCGVERTGEGWRVSPPSFRFDLTVETDLIEEIARLYGYERIPGTTRALTPIIRVAGEARVPERRVRQRLVDRGYHEAITFSFVDAEWDQLIHPTQSPLALGNPISRELAVMRTSLWPGLLKVAQYNLNRQQTHIKLFETGLRFSAANGPVRQIPSLAGLATGGVLPEQWGVTERDGDFFDIKGDLEAVFDLTGRAHAFAFRRHTHPALHPGQSAAVYHSDQVIGWVGALHPDLETRLGLEQRVYMFELDLEPLHQGSLPKFQPLSKFPAIRRDIAIVVDDAVAADQIRQCIAELGIAQLQEVRPFDLYTGKGIASGRKSVALGLILQDLSRTLTDDEVDRIESTILSKLNNDLGATLRE